MRKIPDRSEGLHTRQMILHPGIGLFPDATDGAEA